VFHGKAGVCKQYLVMLVVMLYFLYLSPVNMFLLRDLLSGCLLNLSGVCYLIGFDRLIIGFERKKIWVFFTII
jgi:hypothetical protein